MAECLALRSSLLSIGLLVERLQLLLFPLFLGHVDPFLQFFLVGDAIPLGS